LALFKLAHYRAEGQVVCRWYARLLGRLPVGLLLRNPGFAYMHLSKARLVEGWRSAPALEMDFLEVLKDARECFEVAASLIRTVEARILIAGAVVMAEDDKRPRRHASPG
jgi:hypothetical protein